MGNPLKFSLPDTGEHCGTSTMMRKTLFNSTVLFVAMICGFGYTGADDQGVIIKEASGIARDGDRLIIVGDDADGKYFELDLAGRRGPIIPIDPGSLREITLPGAELAMDLEAIDILADGRIAMLSEQLRCLIARENRQSPTYSVIAEYDRSLTEFGNRGLEGLAVLRNPDGSSKIAVLWEGGYPIYEFVPADIRESVGRKPMKPVIVVHEVGKYETADLIQKPLKQITLHVPRPPGEEPSAQRFRGTDLVWYTWNNEEAGGAVEGFIVLLSSLNSPSEGSGVPQEYKFKFLQRFDLQGQPVGEPLDLISICREYFEHPVDDICGGMEKKSAAHMRDVISAVRMSHGENINWEGLGWFEEGKSLIAIYDTWPLDPPFAMVFDIPESWK